MASNTAREAKLIAMRAICKPNLDDQIRSIFRWYSKTFSTPLHEVPDLPLSDVLVAYFEEQYEEMEPAELEYERKQLTMTARDREKAIADEDAAEEDGMDLLREMEEEARQLKNKKQPPLPEIEMDFSKLDEK